MRMLVMVLMVVALALITGCPKPYPAWMDSPEMGKAAIEFLKDANKQYMAENELFDPGVEFYYKMGFGAETRGIKSQMIMTANAGSQLNRPTASRPAGGGP